MANKTGEMFQATLGIEDKASKPIGNINDNIEKAVGGSGKLVKGFKSLETRLDRMSKQAKKIDKQTNKIGVVGAALFGTSGKGGLVDQFKSTTGMLSKLTGFMKNTVVSTMFSIGDAALWAAEKAALLASVMSGYYFLSYFPKAAAGATVEVIKLVGVIEELQVVQEMTTKQAISMGSKISSTMLDTAANIEKVESAYIALAKQGQLNVEGAQDIATAAVYMSDAWHMGVDGLVEFNYQLNQLFQIGSKSLVGVASAMDKVARNTSITREELMGLISSLENDLLYRIPRDLRSKVMPKLIADISAIAGAWKDMFGDPASLFRGVKQILDPFNEEGMKLQATIIGFGGATAASMQKMRKEGDISGMVIAQTKAVQNLKAEMGDQAFIDTASIYAGLLGMETDAYLKMSEASIDKMEASKKAAQEELKNTKSIRAAWEKAQGVFNNVWTSLENIGKAILIAIGEPLLEILIPAFNWLGKVLQKIVGFFKGISEGTKRVMGIITAVGTLAAILMVIVPIVTTFGTIMLAAAGAIGGALVWALGALVSALTPVIGPIIGIGAALVLGAMALYDFGTAFYEGVAPALSAMWSMFKVISIVIAAIFLPAFVAIVAVIAAVILYWDEFIEALKPGIDAIKFVWNEFRESFKDIGTAISEAFGGAGEASEGFLGVISSVLKYVAIAFGKVVKYLAYALAGIMAIGLPVVKLFLMIWKIIAFGAKMMRTVFSLVADAISAVIDSVKFLWEMFKVDATSGLLDKFKSLGTAILNFLSLPMDYIYDAISKLIVKLSSIPGLGWLAASAAPFAVQEGVVPAQLASGGITTEDNIPANLHANEAIIPLDQLPEVIGSVVNIDMGSVITELKTHRRLLERIARHDGMLGGGG